MTINTNLFQFGLAQLLRNADDEGGTGGGDTGDAGDAGEGNTDGSIGEGDATGIPNAGQDGDDGGTAEGQDNTGDDKDSVKDGDDKGDDDDKDGDDTVPEEYDFSGLELPDGMELDQGMAEAMAPGFKEVGLTQTQANQLASIYAQQVAAQTEAHMESIEKTMDEWVDTAKADKEIGKDNWEKSTKAANDVVRKFGTPELVKDVLVGQGIGNHPEVIRLLSRVGQAFSEDTFNTGGDTDTEPVAKEVSWYGNTTPTQKAS